MPMRRAALASIVIAAAWAALPAIAQKVNKVDALTIKQGVHAEPPPQPGFSAASQPSPSGRLPDPVARQLNRALALAGALHKEVAEGRGQGKRASGLVHELRHTLQGVRDEKGVAEVLAEIEALPPLDVGGYNAQFMRQTADKLGRMKVKLSSMSRTRHETAKNAISNQK